MAESEGIDVCTAFVRYGRDYICGFNMDINVEALDWRLYMDESQFAVALRMANPADYVPAGTPIPPAYTDSEGGVLRIHGVNREGCFAGQLNNMRSVKAAFEIGENCVPLYHLVDGFIRGKYALSAVEGLARKKKVVNLPEGVVGSPDMGMHALMSDGEGHILVVEPGNGVAAISERYAVMTNFAVLELPGDFTPEHFGYYGKDRYDAALSILRESDDDFSVCDGLRLLDAVKQTGRWGTRVSFVYSGNENAVYYTTEHDFAHIRVHRFV